MTAYTQDGRGGRLAEGAGGLQRAPAAALGGARRHDRVLPRRTRPGCPTSTCCTCPRARRCRPRCSWPSVVPARRLPPRGHHRPPARRHRHRRRGWAARSTRRCGRARTSRRCGSTCSPASVDWVVSDHACCKDETKFGDHRDDIFAAKSRLRRHRIPAARAGERGSQARAVATSGSRELTSAGTRRGASACAARATSREGFDADIALVDPDRSRGRSHAGRRPSRPRSTRPFRGLEIGATVDRHVPARPVGVRGRRGRRGAVGALPAPTHHTLMRSALRLLAPDVLGPPPGQVNPLVFPVPPASAPKAGPGTGPGTVPGSKERAATRGFVEPARTTRRRLLRTRSSGCGHETRGRCRTRHGRRPG